MKNSSCTDGVSRRIRAKALEEAAKVCEQRAYLKAYDLNRDAEIRYMQDKSTSLKLAAAIRALKAVR